MRIHRKTSSSQLGTPAAHGRWGPKGGRDDEGQDDAPWHDGLRPRLGWLSVWQVPHQH